jgi:mRNA-degrading endonuclease toxin of MazEF toxin-antitoxin module
MCRPDPFFLKKSSLRLCASAREHFFHPNTANISSRQDAETPRTPFSVPLREKKKKDSIINLSQIRTIDKKRLITPKLATLSEDSIKKVDDALKKSMALS